MVELTPSAMIAPALATALGFRGSPCTKLPSSSRRRREAEPEKSNLDPSQIFSYLFMQSKYFSHHAQMKTASKGHWRLWIIWEGHPRSCSGVTDDDDDGNDDENVTSQGHCHLGGSSLSSCCGKPEAPVEGASALSPASDYANPLTSSSWWHDIYNIG